MQDSVQAKLSNPPDYEGLGRITWGGPLFHHHQNSQFHKFKDKKRKVLSSYILRDRFHITKPNTLAYIPLDSLSSSNDDINTSHVTNLQPRNLDETTPQISMLPHRDEEVYHRMPISWTLGQYQTSCPQYSKDPWSSSQEWWCRINVHPWLLNVQTYIMFKIDKEGHGTLTIPEKICQHLGVEEL